MAIRWTSWRVACSQCGRVRCEPGWRLDAAWSARLQDFDLWYVWAGRGRMRLKSGREVELRPGVAIWCRPGGVYLAEQDPQHRLGVSYVHFDLVDEAGRGWHGTRGLPGEVHHAADASYVDAVLRRVIDLLGRGDPASRAPAEALFRGVLMDFEVAEYASRRRGSTSATRRRQESLVTELAGAIRENPAEAPTVRELAAKAHCSSDHLARMFRSVTGQSPQQFIVQARVDRAKVLLRETAMSITQIADALGYTDVYFFSRQFADKAGVTATAYRGAGA